MFISDDRLYDLAENNCFLDGEKSYLIKLLRELRFFRERSGRSPIKLMCRVFDAIVCLRLTGLR